LNGNVWGPFPHTSTYQEIQKMLLFFLRVLCCNAESTSSKATDVESTDIEAANAETAAARVPSWSWCWNVDVYVNDSSGWIVQRTKAGWEVRPNLSGPVMFTANVVTRRPPKSGWTVVEAESSTLNVFSVSMPFRFQSWPNVASWPSRIHGATLTPLMSGIRRLGERCSISSRAEVGKGTGSDHSTPLISTEADVENPTTHTARGAMSLTEGEVGDCDWPPRTTSQRGTSTEMLERASSARPNK